MARGSDSGKQEQRARERAAKGLARHDLELALEGLLGLPAAARGELVRPVAALFRASLLELHRSGGWARLHTLAARAEGELGLLESGGEGASEEPHELRWALMLGCLHARDWDRAARYLAPMRPLIDQRAPALARALVAWIETRGELPAEILAAGGIATPPAPAQDPRLGHEPAPRPRAPLPTAPAAAGDAEQQVLALAGTQSFNTFSETLLEWQRRAGPEVGAALARAAVPLAVREMLAVLERGGRPVDASVLLARLAHLGPPTQELADEVKLGVRLALPSLLEGPRDRGIEAAVRALGRAAAHFAEARGFVINWVSTLEARREHVAFMLLLVEGMLSDPESPGEEDRLRLWSIAVVAVAGGTPEGADPARAAPWLLAATQAVLAAPDLLGRFLRGLPIQSAAPLVAASVDVLSVEGATGVVAAAWEAAGEPLRKAIAPLVAELIDRAQADALDRVPEELVDAELLDRVMCAMDRDEPPPLLPRAQAVWRRLGPAALPYDPELLTIAVLEARDEATVRLRVEEYLSGRSDIQARLEALRAVGGTQRTDLGRLLLSLEQGVLRDFASDPLSLGRGLSWSFDRGAPSRFVRLLAVALLDAVAQHPPPRPVAAPLAKALALAARMAKARTGRKNKPGQAKKAPKQKRNARKGTGERPEPPAQGTARPNEAPPSARTEQLGFSFDRSSS